MYFRSPIFLKSDLWKQYPNFSFHSKPFSIILLPAVKNAICHSLNGFLYNQFKVQDCYHGIQVPVCVLSCFSCAWLFLTLWTIAHQVPLSMGFSRQEYWSGLPCLVLAEFSQPRDQTHISCVSYTGRQILYHCATWGFLELLTRKTKFRKTFRIQNKWNPFPWLQEL